MRTMRRQFQEVEDLATLERWLTEAPSGRLATVDEQGYPVIKPVCFAYKTGKIYFHSAAEGEKLDDIRRDPRVGFEVDRLFAITPPSVRGCQTHAFYQSVIVRGRARIIDGEAEPAAKERALRVLIGKYAPMFMDTPLKDVEHTAVVEVAIEQMTGKQDFGQRWPEEHKLKIARVLYDEYGDAVAETVAQMGLTMEQVIDEDD